MPIRWRAWLNASTGSSRKTAGSGTKSTHSRPHGKRAAPRPATPASESSRRALHPCRFRVRLRDPRSDHQHQPQAAPHARGQAGRDPRARDRLHVQGAVTAIANYQSSNRDDKFGYLMRHPTAANQVGDTVSEGDDPLGATGLYRHARRLADRTRGDAVRFRNRASAEGTNTDLERNQLQMRRAYVLLGDLDRSPFYASLGKMAVPFGLTDTVNPFTASTVWHAFGALANGLTLGYVSEGLNLSVMGIQGGAQFRAAKYPGGGDCRSEQVEQPRRGRALQFRAGLRRHASPGRVLAARHAAYCQDFPVVHFEPCRDNNPAFGVYGKTCIRRFHVQGRVRTARRMSGPEPSTRAFRGSRPAR